MPDRLIVNGKAIYVDSESYCHRHGDRKTRYHFRRNEQGIAYAWLCPRSITEAEREELLTHAAEREPGEEKLPF